MLFSPIIEPVFCEISVTTPRLNNQTTDEWTIESYVKKLKRGFNPPPILVVKKRNGKIIVLDGFHRLESARRCKKKTLIAWVVLESDLRRLLKRRFNGRIPTCYRELDCYLRCWNSSYSCTSEH